MKFHIRTYGCQMNERDSEAAAAELRRRGHERVDDEASADVVLVNTCSVRAKAEAKAIGKLGLLVAGKRRGSRKFVGAMGCMVQRLGGDLGKAVPGLDFALGTRREAALPDVLERLASGSSPILDTGEDGSGPEMAEHLPGGASAFVNILFGCDRRCAYCVVPLVRGGERSRAAAAVIDEVRRLAESGVKEVTLLGQSVMSYGRHGGVWAEGEDSPLGFREPLPRLLEALSRIPGLARIRFTSGHPSGCTEELARAMGELRGVCPHLHLPLQSGADRILDAMRRGYTADDYRQAVARLRERVPGLAVTTDVIVGFPTETREEFEATRRFMDEMEFDNAFIFKYSPRPATAAAEWKDDVPADEKLRRNHVLLDDQSRRSLAIHRRLLGRDVDVLVDGISPRKASRWCGRTVTNKIVVFDPVPPLKAGDLVVVRVTGARSQALYGELNRQGGDMGSPGVSPGRSDG